MAISLFNFLTQSLRESRFFGGDKPSLISEHSDHHGSQEDQPKTDVSLWNQEVGEMLLEIMTMAGYPSNSKLLHMEFFRESVAPSLGQHPRGGGPPTTWKSFMTDDHSPVELSWCWSAKSEIPTARYSVEPIGKFAGLSSDPLNTAASIRLLGNTLPLSPEVDLYLHRHFQQMFMSQNLPRSDTLEDGTLDVPQSQSFMAFDLLESTMVVKQYYLPTRRALAEGISNAEIIARAIQRLPEPANSLGASLDVIANFLQSFPVESRPAVEIMAIDCLDPPQSRLKIYVRSRETTLQGVIEMLTLGGKTSISQEEEQSLRELWYLVFGLDATEHKDSDDLPEKDHRTAGILYYYELKMGVSAPKSKVYLPVRHYSQNDDQIARGLTTFLEKRGKRLMTGSYYDGVKRLCRHRDLGSGLGFHTYITWASARNNWNITAYFNPEINHACRSKSQD
ncbi:hypothetical protein ARAM_005555 [Aspergillus rambellii]|uniref:Dimethylallyl tryptophan synthase n=1 Tax=Aspergillus rambellii TaxID=308745 RepID=A0A0F8XFK2_9EURO|nr:hypothetical protein ARAM_005555 [Aspergillus rambellii]